MAEKGFIQLTKENIDSEHICCAFSDKKCSESYELKKQWLKDQFEKGYVFRRLDERAKVFIEYGPGEEAWLPVDAPGYFMINCFWVSGQYKGKGYAKALLQSAIDDAVARGKNGLVTVAGIKKAHFMSDTKWLLGQGFEMTQKLPYGFCLLVKKLKNDAPDPIFHTNVLSGTCPETKGLVAYYSHRCPFAEFHIQNSLVESAAKRNLSLTVIKLDSLEKAKEAPTPATIFSLFLDGKFLTSDLSCCLDNRFDKALKG